MEMSNAVPNQPFRPNDDLQDPEAPGDQAAGGSETPQKRRPGRPKGSTKKGIEGEGAAPKLKRPVGRPRKDGFPAGSVSTPRPRAPKQPRHSTGVR